MRENSLRTLMEKGGKAVNGWCSSPSAVAAEVIAGVGGKSFGQGFDSVTIDLQHGLIDYSDALGMLQAISTTEKIPMARVPWLDNANIMKMLDAGAYGIICPMINTADDAENFVQACSYAPRGRRSFGPTRALMYAGADYQPNANDTVLKFAMIETVEAMENMDAIMSTPGLDAVYVGPSDLGLSMGHKPQLDTEVPEVVAAIDAVLAAAKKHKLFAGIHTSSGDYAARMHDKGFDMVSVGSELRLMVNAAQDYISDVKGKTRSTKVAGY